MSKTEETATDNEILLTIPEACRLLRCSRATLYKLRRAGRIEILKLGYRTARVVKGSINKMIEENRQERRSAS